MSITTDQTKKTQQSTESSKSPQDVYDVFQASLDNYFKEVKKNAATYLQATSDLQEEIIESRKKNAENAISLQKAVYEKLGGDISVPDSAIDLAKSFVGEATLSWNLQNKIMLESLETLSKNIEAFNKNSTAFEDINKRLIDYWASVIKQAAKNQSKNE